jgi:hypothetical protein
MPFVAWSLIVNGIGKERVEAEADQEGFTYLDRIGLYISVGIVITVLCAVFGKIAISSHQVVENTSTDIHLL